MKTREEGEDHIHAVFELVVVERSSVTQGYDAQGTCSAMM